MAGFIEIANSDKLPPATGICLSVLAQEVALFNAEGMICAMADASSIKGCRWEQASWKALSLMPHARRSHNGAGLKGSIRRKSRRKTNK
jgi:hypothetical protein